DTQKHKQRLSLFFLLFCCLLPERLACYKKGSDKCDMRYCRKIFASQTLNSNASSGNGDFGKKR
ncbi:MAG TPA: hypothetical protein VHG34_01825, partial [Nitrososphaeraceae archaeon]|nr:hypothetical protein [Nitrososphaeraceae archaeon]